ncbi:transmembrane protein 82-like isoform X1 [Denticeps clupeoides]|uniref:transmembrane protein 82-like isoform X1 n=1 Tax=Denticeps clupeoides TaxID=299321 RepID=UPI0010A439A6|nr:transmembrane protein 82-like isoform X1 [Denticeps clupeoides]
MFSILPSFWSPLNASPLDGILRGVIGACGISVLSNLMRVHLLVRDSSFTPENGTKQQLAYKEKPGFFGRLAGVLHFLCLTGLLSLLGARASSLVVLEFSLRAVLAAVTVGVDGPRGICQFLIQCQFSLGCALSCSIHFLHEEAPHRTLSLLLAAGLSWLLWGQSQRLRSHVAKFYPLHSSERNCGACISLLNTRHNLIPFLSRAVIVTFAVGGVTAICTVNQHFLAEVEAMRFWTLLSLCYTLLLVYIQGEWLAECGTDGTGVWTFRARRPISHSLCLCMVNLHETNTLNSQATANRTTVSSFITCFYKVLEKQLDQGFDLNKMRSMINPAFKVFKAPEGPNIPTFKFFSLLNSTLTPPGHISCFFHKIQVNFTGFTNPRI